MGAFANPNVRRYSPASWWPLSHCDAIEDIPDMSLVAICDTSEIQLRAGLERFPAAAGYSSVAQMLCAESLDLVTIATRTIERPGIIGQIIAAGVKALHIEKPLCNTVAQLVGLEETFRDPELRLSYGTIRRYMPVYQRALEIVESARYGPLENIQIEFGRAALMWTHPHSLDLILFFAGTRAIERVSAHFVPGSVDVDGVTFDGDPVVASVLVEFDDGVIGTISPAGNCDARLRCKGGVVSVESDGDVLRARCAEGDDSYWRNSETLATGDQPGGTGFAIRRLIPPERGGPVVDAGRDKSAIVNGQRLLFACLQSHLEGGRPVTLGQIDPSLSINGRSGERFA
jgi:predicted dehydrogenase